MRPLLFFYLLVIYVILQFSWWAYLLVDLNKEVYHHKIEQVQNSGDANSLNLEIQLYDQLKERWFMVIGEGAVFLAILIFGIFKTRDAFRKEFALARQQKNFLLSVTHEFKSPLAAVKLNLQTLQKRELTSEQQHTIIARAINESDRIDNLIENALLAARIESHSFQLQKEEINLTECVYATIQSRIIPGARAVNIKSDLEDGIYILGDELAISSLILNLLENAEKYSPENSEIRVSLRKERNWVHFHVADQGVGIPDHEKNKIFEKFYRIGSEDTRQTKGTGLGLFIVKHIVNFHKGEIKAVDNHPSGTIFQVTLPAS